MAWFKQTPSLKDCLVETPKENPLTKNQGRSSAHTELYVAITLHQVVTDREVSIVETTTYEVVGCVVNRHDTPHRFSIQVEAADSNSARNQVLGKLRLYKGDLVRDVSVREIPRANR